MRTLRLATGLTTLLYMSSAMAAPLFSEPPSYLLTLPEQAYGSLSHTFADFYRATNFTPTVTNSYFSHSELYDFAGLPLAIAERNGFQLELFTQLYSQSSRAYLNLNQDQSLYGILRADLMEHPYDQWAGGIGIGVPINKYTSVRALASTQEIPGYGSANYAVGFEHHF